VVFPTPPFWFAIAMTIKERSPRVRESDGAADVI